MVFQLKVIGAYVAPVWRLDAAARACPPLPAGIGGVLGVMMRVADLPMSVHWINVDVTGELTEIGPALAARMVWPGVTLIAIAAR